MWRKIARGVGVLVFVALLLLLITFVTPSIRSLAGDLSGDWKVPIFLTGIAAPILFLFKKIGNWFAGLFEGGDSRSVRTENEAIRAEMERLRTDVRDLDNWRREAIHREITEINALKRQIETLQAERTEVRRQIDQVEKATPEELLAGRSAEERRAEYLERMRSLGVVVDN